jgi:hypothetical protein
MTAVKKLNYKKKSAFIPLVAVIAWVIFIPLRARAQQSDSSFNNKKAKGATVIYQEKKFDILHPDDIRTVSRPVVYQDGILFTFIMKDAGAVYLSGSFNNWQKKIPLATNSYGIYYRFLRRKFKKGNYTYRYLADHVWLNDPRQPAYTNDGYGRKMSLFNLQRDILYHEVSPQPRGDNLYHFFLKDRGYTNVSWVGSKNNWDPYVDKMRKEGDYWVIDLLIYPEKIFYKFWVDGKTLFDPRNAERTMMAGGEYVNYVPLRKPGAARE